MTKNLTKTDKKQEIKRLELEMQNQTKVDSVAQYRILEKQEIEKIRFIIVQKFLKKSPEILNVRKS